MLAVHQIFSRYLSDIDRADLNSSTRFIRRQEPSPQVTATELLALDG